MSATVRQAWVGRPVPARDDGRPRRRLPRGRVRRRTRRPRHGRTARSSRPRTARSSARPSSGSSSTARSASTRGRRPPGRRLRRALERRLEPRPEQRGPRRRRAGAHARPSPRRTGVRPDQVPADAVTASGSGLDPHISPAYADAAGRRGSRASAGLAVDDVRRLVAEHTDAAGPRLHRRAAGQRARAQPRPGPARVSELDGRRRLDGASGDNGRVSRGRLRIYLGAAPGVGKTYAMLGEAHRRIARGTDVVVALRRDPRPAADRRRCSAGLEIVPRRGRRAPRRARSRRWTSTPCSRGVPRSRSSTSSRTRTSPAPGTPSGGRTSTVLLDAGIDVISTVNIQHLESLNDVVEAITGRAAARDGAGRRRARGRPDRARRHEPASRCAAGSRTATSTRRRRSTPRSATTSASATSPRCASSRCCGSPTGSRRVSSATGPTTASRPPGRPVSASSSR